MEEDKQTLPVSQRERLNEQRKKYYIAKKEKDPNFLEYKRMKAKEYYMKKKAERQLEVYDVQPTEPVDVPVIDKVKPKTVRTKKEPIPEPIPEPVPDHIQEPIIEPEPVVVEKKHRTRKAKKTTTDI